MRVLVLYAHPVETSYSAALHKRRRRGAEGGRPRGRRLRPLRRGLRSACCRARSGSTITTVGPQPQPVAALCRAAAARPRRWSLVHPVWNFGYPAILKGFFDRVFLPGVSFKLVERQGPAERCTTSGRSRRRLHLWRLRLRALLMGDPPRKMAKRALCGIIHPPRRVAPLLALYDMNRQHRASRERFPRAASAARCGRSDRTANCHLPDMFPA